MRARAREGRVRLYSLTNVGRLEKVKLDFRADVPLVSEDATIAVKRF